MSVDELMELELGAGKEPDAQLRNQIVNFKLQKRLIFTTWVLAIATIILSGLTLYLG